MDCFDRLVTTCQNVLWFCKHGQKGRNRTVNFFFSLNYKSFLIQSGFEQLSSLICWPYRKGMFFTTDWGLWVLKFSPTFGVLSIILATDMLESHSRALKT